MATTVIINMDGFSKIGIVYTDREPSFILGRAQEWLTWTIRFFQESEVLHDPVQPFTEYLAIFFPIDREAFGLRQRIANMFPEAEMIGYRDAGSGSGESPAIMDDGLTVIQIPAPFPIIRFLLENLSAAKIYRRELVRARLHLDNVHDLFHTFADTVESSFKIPDFRLGRSLLINKILANIQADECLLYLLDNSESTLIKAYSTGNIQDIDLFEENSNRSIIGEVFSSGTPYVNNDFCFELRAPFSGESSYIRSILCYPLMRGGEKIGVIELLNKLSGRFTREDRSFMELVLDPLAVTIRAVDQFEELERLTITDDLTKLYNYRYLKKYLEMDVKRCLRHKKKVSLLFIDLDGFKRINDTLGHLVGSHALAEIGQVFKQVVRNTDVVGRYGGDEFVIILPDTPLDSALDIAERIRKKVEEWELVVQNRSIRLTVSLGVANCPQHTSTAEGLIQKADAAMYRAKELSKNSIRTAV
jgi:diguanylate cyclase (GGDEF)-like protein